jgi:dTDP-4-dehydrorhamnose 3,5-epimerase
MIFAESRLKGTWVITLEPRFDERGFFARTYCDKEFAAHGLNTRWPQCNLSLTREIGTIRGMHFQAEPRPEIKLVRCDQGAIYDVVVDVRPGSATFGKWEGFELSPAKSQALYVGAGFAHGFQVLEGPALVFYQMSDSYVPELARGVRWNDPEVGIEWPLKRSIVSERDRNLPLLADLVRFSKG